jgi:hypothetical protein
LIFNQISSVSSGSSSATSAFGIFWLFCSPAYAGLKPGVHFTKEEFMRRSADLFRSALAAIAIAIPLFSQTTPPDTIRDGTLAGWVRDSSGTPVAGAVLELIAVGGTVMRTAMTQTNGTFLIPQVPSQPRCMRVSSTGYPTQYWSSLAIPTLRPSINGIFQVPANDTLRLYMTLVSSPEPGDTTIQPGPDTGYIPGYAKGSISGKVTLRATNGAPLAGIAVAAIPVGQANPVMSYSPMMRSSMTDAQGQYAIPTVPMGDYFIQARAPDTANLVPQYYYLADNQSVARSLHVDTTNITGIDFQLRQGGVIKGSVRDANGAMISGDQISVTITNENFYANVMADAAGNFMCKGLPTGRYSLYAGGGRYLPAGQQTPQQFDVTEGQETVAPALRLVAGAVFSGRWVYPSTWKDTFVAAPRRNFQLCLFPEILPAQSAGDTMLWPSSGVGTFPMSSDSFVSYACLPGNWRVMVMPPVRGQTAFDQAAGKSIIPGAGFTFLAGAPSLTLSQPVYLRSPDTARLGSVVLRPGFSVRASVLADNAASGSVPPANAHITVMVREGSMLYPVSQESALMDGTFELPGLVDNQDYYVYVHADGFPSQFWNGQSTTALPQSPYHFSSAAFAGMMIRLSSNPSGYTPSGPNPVPGPVYGNEPVSTWAEYDSLGKPWIKIRIDSTTSLDSIKLYSRDLNGITNLVYQTVTRGPSGARLAEFKWQEYRDLRAMSYHYVAVASGAGIKMRSRVFDADVRNSRILPGDSLWAFAFGSPEGVEVLWGAGRSVITDCDSGDSIVLLKRTQGTTNWSAAGSWSLCSNMLTDWRWDRSTDSGKTFEYLVTWRKAGTAQILRSSPIISFAVNAAFLSLAHRGKTLLVGAGQQYATIQAAVNAASTYDRIEVLSGTYVENVSLNGKALCIEGRWSNGEPPVVNGGQGAAFTVPFVSAYWWWDRPRISGLKIVGATGIAAKSDIAADQCLFDNCQVAISMLPDSATLAQAAMADVFSRNSISATAWGCTFVSKTTGRLVARLSGRCASAASDTICDFYSLVPRFTAAADFHAENSIVAFYGTAVLPVVAPRPCFADFDRCVFWQTAKTSPSTVQTRTIFETDPQFIDTGNYFMPADSRVRYLAGPLDPIGYDVRRLDQSGGGGSGTGQTPSMVLGFKTAIAGLHAIALTWTPLAASEGVDHYVIFRLAADTSLFYPDQGQWQYRPAANGGSPPPSLATAVRSWYLDTTVEIGRKYIYAVAAVDSGGNLGRMDMPYPPSITSYIVEISYDAFANATVRALKGGQWHMVGAWGMDTTVFGQSTNRQLFRWDDAQPEDKLMSQFVATDRILPGEGCWFYSESDTMLTVNRAAFSRLVQNGGSYSLHLIKGLTGWHQIASPYPFPVAPSWLSTMRAYEWIAAERRYQSTTVLNPWSAVWVYAERDTTIVIDGAVAQSKTPALSKIKRGDGWELQVTLIGDSSSDFDNYCGVLSSGAAEITTRNDPEPPRAFDYAQLYFVRSDRDSTGPQRLARQYKTAASPLAVRLQWNVAIAPSFSAEKVRISGFEEVPSDVSLFWVTPDSIIDIRTASEILVPAHDQTSYAVIVASANKLDKALFSGRFDVRGAYPNPFRSLTTVQFVVPYQWSGTRMQDGGARITLCIYDLTGRSVSTLFSGTLKAGIYRKTWNGRDAYGRNLPAGMYFAKLKSGKFEKTVQMIRVR